MYASMEPDPDLLAIVRRYCWRLLSWTIEHANRTADSGSCQPAVAVRVLLEVLLVVALGEVELGGGTDFGRDRAFAGGLEPLLEHGTRGLGLALLGVAVGQDCGTVLR